MQGWFKPLSTFKLFFEVVKMFWKFFLLNGLSSCAAPEFSWSKRAWKARKNNLLCSVYSLENRKHEKLNIHKEGVCLFVTNSQLGPLLDSFLSFWLFPCCQFCWLFLKPGLLPLPLWLSWYVDCTLCPSWACLWGKVRLVSCARIECYPFSREIWGKLDFQWELFKWFFMVRILKFKWHLVDRLLWVYVPFSPSRHDLCVSLPFTDVLTWKERNFSDRNCEIL